MNNFTLQNNDNTEFNLTEYQGNDFLLLVFFRGAWCNHCKKQLSDINNHYDDFGRRGIKLVALSSDTKFKSSLLKTFLKLKFPILSDEKFAVIDHFNLKTTYKNQIVSKPAIILLAPDQTIAYEYIGDDFDDRLSAKTTLDNIEKITKKL